MIDAVPGPLALIETQALTLFVHDERDRLVCVNEPGQPAGPRFFLGRTTAGNIWRLRHDMPLDLAREIDPLAAAEPIASDLRAPFVQVGHIRDLLEREAPIVKEYCGPAYRFPRAPAAPDGLTIMRTPAEAAALAAHWGTDTVEQAWLPAAVVFDGGRVVSACFCARRSAIAAEAGLETVLAYRRRGYAVRAVAAWAGAVVSEGLMPLYSTSWDNEASRAVARRLGLIMYGVDLHIT